MLFSILNMKFSGEAGQNLQSKRINKKNPIKGRSRWNVGSTGEL